MGVKTSLTLEQANTLFSQYIFERIEPTKDGISDTTYLAFNSAGSYVIKYYEDATLKQIDAQEQLLKNLHNHKLKVNFVLAHAHDKRWKLFSYIDGKSVLRPSFIEIRQIATFLAKMHNLCRVKGSEKNVFELQRIKEELETVKSKNINLYHQLKELGEIKFGKKIGIIHGDLFTDNAKFVSNKLSGVYDFIESGSGSFAQDAGIVALSWASNSQAKRAYFLRCYNSTSKVKLSKEELKSGIRFGTLYYSMRRFNSKSENLDYRELLKKHRAIK